MALFDEEEDLIDQPETAADTTPESTPASTALGNEVTETAPDLGSEETPPESVGEPAEDIQAPATPDFGAYGLTGYGAGDESRSEQVTPEQEAPPAQVAPPSTADIEPDTGASDADITPAAPSSATSTPDLSGNYGFPTSLGGKVSPQDLATESPGRAGLTLTNRDIARLGAGSGTVNSFGNFGYAQDALRGIFQRAINSGDLETARRTALGPQDQALLGEAERRFVEDRSPEAKTRLGRRITASRTPMFDVGLGLQRADFANRVAGTQLSAAENLQKLQTEMANTTNPTRFAQLERTIAAITGRSRAGAAQRPLDYDKLGASISQEVNRRVFPRNPFAKFDDKDQTDGFLKNKTMELAQRYGIQSASQGRPVSAGDTVSSMLNLTTRVNGDLLRRADEISKKVYGSDGKPTKQGMEALKTFGYPENASISDFKDLYRQRNFDNAVAMVTRTTGGGTSTPNAAPAPQESAPTQQTKAAAGGAAEPPTTAPVSQADIIPKQSPQDQARARLASIEQQLAKDKEIEPIWRSSVADRLKKGQPMFGMGIGERRQLENEAARLRKELGNG